MEAFGSVTMLDRLQYYPDTSENITAFFEEKLKEAVKLKESTISRVIIQEEFHLREFLFRVLRLSKSSSCGWIYFHLAHEWDDFPEVEFNTQGIINEWINVNIVEESE